MGLVFLIKILADNRIDLVDNHKHLTSTYKNQTCLRQALRNRTGLSGADLANVMTILLKNGNIMDDNPLIQGYINGKLLPVEKQAEITNLIEDQANSSFVSNYDYEIYKKKADTQDHVIKLLQDQLDRVTKKLEKLEEHSQDQTILSRISNYQNNTDHSITDLKREITSLRSENRLLTDKINKSTPLSVINEDEPTNPPPDPTPDPNPNPETISSATSSTTSSNDSINTRITIINNRLDRIETYLFSD